MLTVSNSTVGSPVLENEICKNEICKNENTEENIVTRESELIGIINTLQQKIEDLETRLKKYTNGENHKRYYEKNKEKIKEKIKETGSSYLKKLKEENPEKIKEYSRNAYIKKKQKKELEDKLLLNEIITKDNLVETALSKESATNIVLPPAVAHIPAVSMLPIEEPTETKNKAKRKPRVKKEVNE